MAEKFRRVKKEESSFIKKINKSRFWLGGLAFVLLFVFATGGAVFFWNKKNLAGSEESKLETKDKNLAAILCQNENCFWLNKDGVSFNRGAYAKGNVVLSLKDESGRKMDLGEEILKPETIAELSFLKTRIWEDFKISLKGGEIKDSDSTDFDFVTGEGWKLRLTINENAYKTLETFKQTITEIQKTAPTPLLEYIDLRIPSKVYYKFK